MVGEKREKSAHQDVRAVRSAFANLIIETCYKAPNIPGRKWIIPMRASPLICCFDQRYLIIHVARNAGGDHAGWRLTRESCWLLLGVVDVEESSYHPNRARQRKLRNIQRLFS